MTARIPSRPLAWLLIAMCLACPPAVTAQQEDGFVVEDIEVHGLQRITEGTLYNYLPVSIGDELTPARTAQALRALFATTFFRDVELRRDGNTLVIVVVERPTIAHFAVEGNRDIKDEDLRDVLRGIGLAEGRIFNRSVLEGVEIELRRQYFSNGKYAVQVDTKVTELENNTVSIRIEISEGKAARIKRINFVGNDTFDGDTLRDALELSEPNWLSWYRKDDQYSREKLQGDLEELRSWYMDRGYANFGIESVQVAISPDKRDMYITLAINEGEQYTFGEKMDISGDLVVPEEELRRLILPQPGETFSRRRVTETTEWMGVRLGEDGYANAEITPIPDIDHESKTVDLVFFVEPGRRVYVRRIEFSGADGTNDETFRREMRQLEGTWLRTSAIERSKVRLQRLPFVENVELETTPVPGSTDLVDLEVEVEERTPGNFNFGFGYSEAYGLILNTGVTHANFLGEGKRAQVDLNRSDFSESYMVNYLDPYWTTEGVSRSVGVFYRDVDQLFAQGSPFFMNSYGMSVSFGIPTSEFNVYNLGLAVRDTELTAGITSAQSLIDWVRNPNHGDNFEEIFPDFPIFNRWGTRFRTLELTGGWRHDTRNRSIFATRGTMYNASFELAVPPSDVTYAVVGLRNERYFPLTDSLTFAYNAEANVAFGTGSTSAAPPYKIFFAGGPESVRGYRESWLGPLDNTGRPEGGNIRLYAQSELILPLPVEALKNSSRFSLFFDIGNVFRGRDAVELDELRMSVGIGITWLAPMGAMNISLARAINAEPDDQTETFQFSLGSSF